MDDTPDILDKSILPEIGIYFFLEIDDEGSWKNNMFESNNDLSIVTKKNCQQFSHIVKFQQQAQRVGSSMNKAIDGNKKMIFSCNPFIVSFKKKCLLNDDGSIDKTKLDALLNNIPVYIDKAISVCLDKESCRIEYAKLFSRLCCDVVTKLHNEGFIKKISPEHYINIYLKNIPFDEIKKAHDHYLEKSLFNDEKQNVVVGNKTYGIPSFLTSYNQKKRFLIHQTASFALNTRVSDVDSKFLFYFENMLNNKILPNPLPIIIDNSELSNEVVRLFNENGDRLSYKNLISKLFVKTNIKFLSNYYLINHSKGKKVFINDVDFVPKFDYYIELCIKNIFGITQNSVLVNDQNITTVFDLEEIFNYLTPKYQKDTKKSYGFLIGNYYNEATKTMDLKNNISGKNTYIVQDNIWIVFLKYRKQIYDYIYKSKKQAIDAFMIDDICYNAIMSDISMDDIKDNYHTKRDDIKRKLNIWFSLLDYINNISISMSSKIKELQLKMTQIVEDENLNLVLETDEEFAFAAGQIVSYLIDCSAASGKTYSMLEPYLQKGKVSLLQDAIANSIVMYKHEISVSYKKVKRLSAQVLTYSNKVDTKPLLKFILAGCFSESVLY